MNASSRTPTRHKQRGAALLMAMVIVTLVATMAASMVWQQWRAVQIETAERARTQADWILVAAMDFARLILRQDNKATDDLTDNWAKPIAESRLSALLAADTENNSADNADIPEAFLSGRMDDAHAKFNLSNLVDPSGAPDKVQLAAFKRLLAVLSIPSPTADIVAEALSTAALAELSLASSDVALLERLGGEQGRAQAPVMPASYDQLVSVMDGATLERLRPYVTLLPPSARDTKININTAPAQVIQAVIPGLDLARASRIVQERQRKPFKDLKDMTDLLGAAPAIAGSSQAPSWDVSQVDFRSEYFEITVRLRYEDNVVEQRYLVHRDGNDVAVLQRSRFSGLDKTANTAPAP